jgi:hypothetical protein
LKAVDNPVPAKPAFSVLKLVLLKLPMAELVPIPYEMFNLGVWPNVWVTEIAKITVDNKNLLNMRQIKIHFSMQ